MNNAVINPIKQPSTKEPTKIPINLKKEMTTEVA